MARWLLAPQLVQFATRQLHQVGNFSQQLPFESAVGQRPTWLAYPYGRWDARVAQAVTAAGYRGGWTLAGADVTAHTSWGAAPRVNIPSSLSLDAFAAWVSGVAHWRARRADYPSTRRATAVLVAGVTQS